MTNLQQVNITNFPISQREKQAQRDTDSAQAASIFGEDGNSFNHLIYQGVGILRKIEVFCGDEFHDFLGFAFSAHILLGNQFCTFFFICFSWSISSLICLIRRSTFSLPSIVSNRSESLSRSWSLFSITRGLIVAFSPPMQCISASCRGGGHFFQVALHP